MMTQIVKVEHRMGKNQHKTIVQGALLLTIAAFISKVLSATYRIPLQNLTGDLGFYIYQQVYPLIGMVMILSLYGFPVAISKLTAELKRERQQLTYRTFYMPLFFILLLINSIFFVVVFFMASHISNWIGDENLKGTFQIAAFLFLFVPFLALLRGVFQGHGEMRETAYSQIIEQCIRVGIIIYAAFLIFNEKINIYQIGDAGVIATMVGMIVAILGLLVFFIRKNPIHWSSNTRAIPWRYYLYSCVSLGLAASLNHLVLILVQFVDVLTLVPNLITYGLTPSEAMETKGVFDRGQPLIQFGVIFGSSFALALIPTVIRENLQANKDRISYVREALLFGFYLSAGATIGLILILPEANLLLFMNTEGTGSLQIFVIAIFILTITITGAAILQSLGFLKQTVLWIAITLMMKWGLNQLLVPSFSIYGSALATVLSLSTLCFVMMIVLHKKLPALAFFRHIRWVHFMIASSSMALYIIGVKFVFHQMVDLTRLHSLYYVLFVVLSGGFIYISLLLRYRIFSENQISALPFSKQLLQLQRIVSKNEL